MSPNNEVGTAPVSGTLAEVQPFTALLDADPYRWYASARARGGVIWDASFRSWMATSYVAVREIGRADNVSFQRQDAEDGSEYDTIAGGRRNVKNLTGSVHTRLHSWLMSAFSPAKASVIQDVIVRDVVSYMLQDLRDKESVDMVDFLNAIPPRVIAAVLELPWRDEEWMAEALVNINRVFDFYAKRGLEYGDAVEVARLAHVHLRDMMDPFLREAARGGGDGLLSGLSQAGPSILEDWTVEDTYINIMSLFLGGAHTSTLTLANILYVLLRDPELLQRARADDDTLRAVIEQVLRLYPPMHYTQRRVKEDVVIDGAEMKKGDLVTLLLASANRDETRFAHPDTVDLEQRNQRDHVTFFAGQHACIGQGLARAELFQTIRQTLAQFPDIALREGGEQVEFRGLNFRGFSPLSVSLR